MNADPRVMEFFPSIRTREQTHSTVERAIASFDRHGFGWWAVEVPGAAPFIGFIGLAHPGFDSHFTPCVEVGWRLAFDHWGQGYATEGARAALSFGFDHLQFPEIVSFTAVDNHRSRRVMVKLGMTHSSTDDFDHPSIDPEHRLCWHVLYRMSREQWDDQRMMNADR
jgi:RimJ/RimL family protein N-acetyltransferase